MNRNFHQSTRRLQVIDRESKEKEDTLDDTDKSNNDNKGSSNETDVTVASRPEQEHAVISTFDLFSIGSMCLLYCAK